MLIETHAAVALLCPNCGRLSWHVLSLFSLGRKQSFDCECGTHLLIVERRRKNIWFHIECVFCRTTHSQPLTRKEIVAPYAREFRCHEGDYVTGCLGPREEVKRHFNVNRRSLAQVAREVGSPDYFQDCTVMFSILERLYDMAETGELSCSCGNPNLAIEIFPDKVEISCPQCGREVLVPAALPEDLDNFLCMGIFPMETGEFIRPRRQKLQRLRHGKSQMD